MRSIQRCLHLVALPKTEAASRIRTPLTEFAVGATVLLGLVFPQATDESIGCYLKTHAVFIDKLLLALRHSPNPSSTSADSKRSKEL